MCEGCGDKLKSILNGYGNLLFKSPEIEQLAKKRAKKCKNCAYLLSINVCSQCGCFIPAKIRSENEKCPKEKW